MTTDYSQRLVQNKTRDKTLQQVKVATASVNAVGEFGPGSTVDASLLNRQIVRVKRFDRLYVHLILVCNHVRMCNYDTIHKAT